MKKLENKICFVRNQRVMLDSDLASIYGVNTKRLNEQVKRNLRRFPPAFMFRLTREEWESLKSQIATSKKGGKRKLPYVFTEHGAVMLATVLRSKTAIKASILVVDAFVKLNDFITKHKSLSEKLRLLEQRTDKHDQEIQVLFQAIRQLISPAKAISQPIKRVGYRRNNEED